MRIDRLRLQDFRNYQDQQVDFDPRCNVIFGENAEGKTNLLEGILYLSCGRSPRARSDKELIRFDALSARLEGQIASRERDFRVTAELFRGRRRKLSINGVAAKNGAELSQVYNTVFFCPEDLYLIRDGAPARRRFMDGVLSQLRPRYAMALSEYHRSYEHKTRILRDSEEKPGLLSTLPEFNERLIHFGAILIYYRARFVRRLETYAAAHHLECSGGKEELKLHYTTVSSIEDPFAPPETLAERLREHMESHQAAELASRLCLSGPHKDDLAVTINGRDARAFSSQGQTRTAALALKLAERQLYRDTTGEYPLLLLDDVLSELDPHRQEFVLNRISEGQVFITCCEDDRLPQMLGGKVLRVRQGTLV